MTAALLLLDGPLRWAAFALLATSGGLVVGRLARSRGASVRHGACFLALLAAIALPVATLVLPRVDVVVAEATTAAAAAPARSLHAALAIAGALWAAVAALLVARLGVRALAVRQLVRKATSVTSRRVQAEARVAARSAGLSTAPRVVTHPQVGAPAAWGVRGGVVFLPADADLWGRGRLRAVLLHESAHLARRDPLTQLIADAACAVFWFVPTAWLCAARMRREREIACDELVVRGGARPSGYARMLLRWSCDRAVPRAAAALGGVSELEARIRALVSPRRVRSLVTRDERALACAAVLVAVALGASLRPVMRVVAVPVAETARAAVAASAPSITTPRDPTTAPVERLPAPQLDAPLNTVASAPHETLQQISGLHRPAEVEDVAPGGAGTSALRREITSLADVFDADGRLLGGAVWADPERGLVIDGDVLKAFLGLPDDTHVETIVAPLVLHRRGVRRR